MGVAFGFFLFYYLYRAYSFDYSPRKTLKITLTKVILFYIVFVPILLGVNYWLGEILPDIWWRGYRFFSCAGRGASGLRRRECGCQSNVEFMKLAS